MLQFFDGPEDLDHYLQLVEARIVPILDWIDDIEDPAHKAKVKTALFIHLTKKAVLEHGLDVETATHIIERLIPTILG